VGVEAGGVGRDRAGVELLRLFRLAAPDEDGAEVGQARGVVGVGGEELPVAALGGVEVAGLVATRLAGTGRPRWPRFPPGRINGEPRAAGGFACPFGLAPRPLHCARHSGLREAGPRSRRRPARHSPT